MSIAEQLIYIIEKSTSADTIDVGKVYKLVTELDRNKNFHTMAIQMLLSELKNKTKKGFISIQILQMFISMAASDWALVELCSDESIHDLSETLKNVHIIWDQTNSCPFKDDLLKLIQEIALEHENHDKYRKICGLYKNLKRDGFEFPKSESKSNKKEEKINQSTTSASISNDPADSDIQLAIRLSLEESEQKSKIEESANFKRKQRPLPPLPGDISIPAKVVYDFQAGEPDELSIKAGDNITITRKCNDSWWRGECNGKSGIFPSNFVVPIDSLSTPIVTAAPVNINVDPKMIDDCLNLLLNANPIHADEDEHQILTLEKFCRNMRSEIMQTLNKLQQQNAKYEEVEQQFNQAVSAYQQIVLSDRPTYSESHAPYQPPQEYSEPSFPSMPLNYVYNTNPNPYMFQQDSFQYQPPMNTPPTQQPTQQLPYYLSDPMYRQSSSSLNQDQNSIYKPFQGDISKN